MSYDDTATAIARQHGYFPTPHRTDERPLETTRSDSVDVRQAIWRTLDRLSAIASMQDKVHTLIHETMAGLKSDLGAIEAKGPPVQVFVCPNGHVLDVIGADGYQVEWEQGIPEGDPCEIVHGRPCIASVEGESPKSHAPII